ncbi:IclR family transcriptional regulator [uncultured Marinobacter sp.]|uniref:IclR family transcriptional regulator n=1 Tax=uncultured Marinobacter sp. TaxID=187379 RepID=UPI0030D9B7A1|tara:strand:+ start:14769 stop:15566 length:798 start_codon:yes stop_codon:yes gene_type:complete
MKATQQGGQIESRHGGIQVIARAAAILRELGDHPEGLSLAEIARAVDLPRSTIQRIIAALETEGFVEMVGSQGGHRLGPELGRLLYHTRIDVISVVRPLLADLCHEVGETVVFCGVEHYQVQVLERVVAEQELRVVPSMGRMQVPFHSTSVGKALLAIMTDDAIAKILDKTLTTDNPDAPKREALMGDISRIRSAGFAEDYEEYMAGLASIAVSLDTYFGKFAVAIVAPISRALIRKQEYMEPLKAFKAKVEAKIGECYGEPSHT